MEDLGVLPWAIFEGVFYSILALLFALLFLITVHELGHFFAARYFGVRVLQFSIGFGRELWGRTDRHGTRWSFSAIPAGGYVQIFGDVDPLYPKIWDKSLNAARPLSPEELKVAFCTKPVWQRMIIVLAGPAVNFFLALFTLAILFSTYGQGSSQPKITGIDIGGAGYAAGIRLGDEIISVNGKSAIRFEEISDLIMFQPKETYRLRIKRGEAFLDIPLKPKEVTYTDLKGVSRAHGRAGMANFRGLKLKELISVDGIQTKDNPDLARSLLMARLGKTVRVGIEYRNDEVSIYEMQFPASVNTHLSDAKSKDYDTIFIVDKKERYYVQISPLYAMQRSLSNLSESLIEFYKIAGARIAGKNDEQMIAGFGKMSEIASDYAQAGWYSYIVFLCMFSFQLAILNILPIPALDGGYMVFLTIEGLRGKAVSQRAQNYATIIGMVILGGIMLFANLIDLYSLIF